MKKCKKCGGVGTVSRILYNKPIDIHCNRCNPETDVTTHTVTQPSNISITQQHKRTATLFSALASMKRYVSGGNK